MGAVRNATFEKKIGIKSLPHEAAVMIRKGDDDRIYIISLYPIRQFVKIQFSFYFHIIP